MTPEQEAEAIQIELELRRRRGQTATVSTSETSAPNSTSTTVSVSETPALNPARASRAALGDPMAAAGELADMASMEADKLKARGWESLSPTERLKLMALSAPKFIKQEVLGPAEGAVERAAPIAAGQFLGRATRIPGADRVGGAIGGAVGETIAEVREGGEIRPGAVIGAALSGAITGKPLAGAGGREVAAEALKYGATNLGATTVSTVVDEQRLPTAGEAIVSVGAGAVGAPAAKAFSEFKRNRPPLYDMEMETLRDLRKEGIVIPPHEIGMGSDTVSSIAGKAALQQEAAKRNLPAWQRLVREEAGLSKEALPIRPLSKGKNPANPSELDKALTEAGAPYRELQTIQKEASSQLQDRLREIAKESDPHTAQMRLEEPSTKNAITILETLAAADVDELKLARDTAKRAREAFYAGSPAAYDTWHNAKAKADQIESAIERAAASLGDDKLLNRLRESRERIAKIYAIDESINPGNGFVDPVVFGRMIANGDKLTGNLEKIGKFQLAFRREAVESSRVPAPGVGNVGAMATTAMASRGDAPGVIGALFNATAGRAARPYLLSDFFQEGMVNPQQAQNFRAAMARYLAEMQTEGMLAEDEPELVDTRR